MVVQPRKDMDLKEMVDLAGTKEAVRMIQKKSHLMAVAGTKEILKEEDQCIEVEDPREAKEEIVLMKIHVKKIEEYQCKAVELEDLREVEGAAGVTIQTESPMR